MHIVYTVLLILHIASAALLVGAPTGMLRNLKRTLDLSAAAFSIAAEDATRRYRIVGIASIITLATGLSLIFTLGGFKAVPVTIHIALTLMLAGYAVTFTIIKPHTARLGELSQATSVDKPSAQKSIRRLAMGQGILHLLWFIILVLMLVRIA